MCIAALALFAILVGPSVAIPVDYSLATNYPYDYYNGYSNSYSGYYDNYYGNNGYYGNGACDGLAACRPAWPFDTYGSVLTGSTFDAVSALGTDFVPAYPDDYGYSYGYPGAVNYAKENFVRGYGFGPTEVGTRDEVTVRPNIARVPFARSYSPFFWPGCLSGINRYSAVGTDYDFGLRRTFPFGLNAVSASTVGGLAGDPLFLRK